MEAVPWEQMISGCAFSFDASHFEAQWPFEETMKLPWSFPVSGTGVPDNNSLKRENKAFSWIEDPQQGPFLIMGLVS